MGRAPSFEGALLAVGSLPSVAVGCWRGVSRQYSVGSEQLAVEQKPIAKSEADQKPLGRAPSARARFWLLARSLRSLLAFGSFGGGFGV
ncbi:MAG: hypothetical protein D6765_11680 [Bacteroidetes bacterium]|nr:MAG: hypothetical protein D6765_11680 [Bacteroidota bacterium]